MEVVVTPGMPTVHRQASAVLMIASDLERLRADLDLISRPDDASLTLAVEDARHALSRAVIAVREVLAASAAGPFMTVAIV